MHQIQQRLLALSRTNNLGKMTLREIGVAVGVKHPQKVKFHMDQLEKKNLLLIGKNKTSVKPVKSGSVEGSENKLINIPILGTANCGPATFYADSNLEGYLKVSPSVIGKRRTDNLYALRTSGDSMNRAKINGETLEDGDFALIEHAPLDFGETAYTVNIYEGQANIKKLVYDTENDRILLLSQSTREIPPIVIHRDDKFQVSGKVVGVIKKP